MNVASHRWAVDYQRPKGEEEARKEQELRSQTGGRSLPRAAHPLQPCTRSTARLMLSSFLPLDVATVGPPGPCPKCQIWYLACFPPGVHRLLHFTSLLSTITMTASPVPDAQPASSPQQSIYESSTQFRHWRFSPEQLAHMRSTLNQSAVSAIRDAFEADSASIARSLRLSL